MTLSGSTAWLCMLKSPAARRGKSTSGRASGGSTDLVDPGREREYTLVSLNLGEPVPQQPVGV